MRKTCFVLTRTIRVGVRRINQSATCLSDSNPIKSTNRDGFNFTDNVVEKEEEVNKHRQQLKDDDDEFTYQMRSRILEAALPFVPDLGWSRKTLVEGASSLGHTATASGMFPRGGIELAEYFYESSNQRLAEKLAEQVESLNQDNQKLKVGPFVRGAVESRLRMLIPYLGRWPEAMGLMTLPQNACTALGNLSNLTDTIWFHAGDKSVDMNWYSKRITLAGVYKTTEIFMLQDESADFTETWTFLERRMKDLATYGTFVKQLQDLSSGSGDAAWSAYHVTRNILGMNSSKR